MSSYGVNARNKIQKIRNFSIEIIIRSKVLPGMAPQFSTEQTVFIKWNTTRGWGREDFFKMKLQIF